MAMRARILLVDDDPWILKMVSSVLERHGHHIETAHDGFQALDRAKDAPPDLIITDVVMPRMDGFTFVKQLRSQPQFSFVPVIFLTGLPGAEDRVKGFRLGADDYLAKPFRFEELDARVARSLRNSQTIKQEAKPTARDGSPGIHGDLRQLGLSSLLAMLELERKSGVLVLKRKGEVGRVFVKQGRVMAARVDGEEVRAHAAAIFHLLTWPQGQFDFSVADVDMEDQVGSSTTHLLMEGARRMDEADREKKPAKG